MPNGTGLSEFASRYPARFLDVGIAEEHAVTMAAGMAKQGMIPVVAVYSTFLQRAYDQLIHDVSIYPLHMVFAVDRAGISGEDGETHQGLFRRRVFVYHPHMTVLCPANERELRAALRRAVETETGPVAVRYREGPRGALRENCMAAPAALLRRDERACVTLVSYGTLINNALEAAELLAARGVRSEVVKLNEIKPLPLSPVQESAGRTGLCAVIEDTVSEGCVGQRLAPSLPGVRMLLYNAGDAFCAAARFRSCKSFWAWTPQALRTGSWPRLRKKREPAYESVFRGLHGDILWDLLACQYHEVHSHTLRKGEKPAVSGADLRRIRLRDRGEAHRGGDNLCVRLYVLNLLMVGTDILLYFRNRQLDAQRAADGEGCDAMPFTQAVLYVSRRPGCAALALSCAELLRACGVRVTAPAEYCAESVRPALDAQPEAAALTGADVAVVVGGDGSILRAAHAAALRGVPILGVNMGRVGFMSELEPSGAFRTHRDVPGDVRHRRAHDAAHDRPARRKAPAGRALAQRRDGQPRGEPQADRAGYLERHAVYLKISRRRRDRRDADGLHGLFDVGGRPHH